MYATNYLPACDPKSILGSVFEQMFRELQDTITPDTENMFDISMFNSCLPSRVSKGDTSRQRLKSIFDTAFTLLDVIGHIEC